MLSCGLLVSTTSCAAEPGYHVIKKLHPAGYGNNPRSDYVEIFWTREKGTDPDAIPSEWGRI